MSKYLEWRDIQGYEGIYLVSNCGEVYSIRNKKNLKCFKTKFGYIRVELNLNGVSKKYSVHRIVAEAFIKKIENKNYVNHINNNPSDNSVSNLEWCTAKENIQHAANQNRLADGRGSKNPMSILTESRVLEIRRLADSGQYKQRDIASMFGLDEKHVSLIILRKRWKHL